jgi:hypothetical protein
MTDIFVDPIIVATPAANAAKEVIVDYLDKLYLWLEEALNSPHTWYYSNLVAAKLLECGQYPGSELLQHWKQMYRIDINIRLISNWVSQFFNEESNLELNLEKLGYLIEPEIDSITIRPEQFSARWHNLVRDEMHPLLAKTAACKHMGDLFAYELRIATLVLVNAKKEIEVSTKISASEPDFEWGINNKITETFPLLFTPEDLPPPTDVLNLWDQGEKGIRYIIDRWYLHYWGSSVATPLKYRFHPCFSDTITKNEIDTQELVLRKILLAAATIITNDRKVLKEKYDLRPLRENEAADAPQRTRSTDSAKAWRVTIIPEGVGWRMHYWKVPIPGGSIIEFANVLKKHDPEEICY